MSKIKNIILLTSRENFVWTSMQEIIPMIEDSWTYLCRRYSYTLKIINVDDTQPTSYIKDLINSDLIVVTCFNIKISRFISILREKMNIDTRIFFYLHGLATISLWPLHRFGILNLFTTNDVFLGTCDGDIRSLNLAFSNIKSKKIPFLIPNFTTKPQHIERPSPLVYIGRISPQKNLDQLILNYAKLSEATKKQHSLILYGEEDNLGYPNLGIKENSYLNKLKIIINENNLNEFVIFKGFVERLKIQEELGSNYIFVSLSTHSDENFGMAAFRSLLAGAQCILTDWGGHKEFKNHYADQISYLKPVLTSNGPLLDATEFQKAVSRSTESLTTKNSEHVPTYPYSFSKDHVCDLLNTEINSSAKGLPLTTTSLALTIYNQQAHFEKDNLIEKCFYSFEDPSFKSFFEAYLN